MRVCACVREGKSCVELVGNPQQTGLLLLLSSFLQVHLDHNLRVDDPLKPSMKVPTQNVLAASQVGGWVGPDKCAEGVCCFLADGAAYCMGRLNSDCW